MLTLEYFEEDIRVGFRLLQPSLSFKYLLDNFSHSFLVHQTFLDFGEIVEEGEERKAERGEGE